MVLPRMVLHGGTRVKLLKESREASDGHHRTRCLIVLRSANDGEMPGRQAAELLDLAGEQDAWPVPGLALCRTDRPPRGQRPAQARRATSSTTSPRQWTPGPAA